MTTGIDGRAARRRAAEPAIDRAGPAPVLDVHDVTVAYHRKPVLWDIDLTLDRPRPGRDRRAERGGQEHADQGDPRPGARWPAGGSGSSAEPVGAAAAADRLRPPARERRLGLPRHACSTWC